MPSFSHHSSSYRDPSGFLFYKEGVLYRQVNQVFKNEFDQFINSGLYQHLAEQQLLVSHIAIDGNLTGTANWYQTLKPEVVPFISYPYEWSFDMLKDAALLTLQLAKEAMDYSMMLKDASAYNVQIHKGKMMFIDTLSFEHYDEQKPWIAYRQFCEQFFAPLALMHYLKEPLQKLSIAYPEGIPLPLAKKLLPFRSKLSLSNYLHLHLHASLSRSKSLKNEMSKPFSKQKMINVLRSLEDGIRSFSYSGPSGVWSDYYEEAYQRKNYISAKKGIISKWLKGLEINTAFDAGANEGEFSELLKDKVSYIISGDFDHYAVNKLYNKVKEKNIGNIHPVIIDLSDPTPAIGVNNKERASFLERTETDLVLALALVHHLAIGKNIPFEHIAEMFHSIGKYLIIEFVPKEDEKVQLMLQMKKDIYSWYTQEAFLKTFERNFSILAREEIGDFGRGLYLMKAYEN